MKKTGGISIQAYNSSPSTGIGLQMCAFIGLLIGMFTVMAVKPLLDASFGAWSVSEAIAISLICLSAAYGVMYPQMYGRGKAINGRIRYTFPGIQNETGTSRLWLQVPAYETRPRGLRKHIPATYSLWWLIKSPFTFLIGIASLILEVLAAAYVCFIAKELWSACTDMIGDIKISNIFTVFGQAFKDAATDIGALVDTLASKEWLGLFVICAAVFSIGYAYAFINWHWHMQNRNKIKRAAYFASYLLSSLIIIRICDAYKTRSMPEINGFVEASTNGTLHGIGALEALWHGMTHPFEGIGSFICALIGYGVPLIIALPIFTHWFTKKKIRGISEAEWTGNAETGVSYSHILQTAENAKYAAAKIQADPSAFGQNLYMKDYILSITGAQYSSETYKSQAGKPYYSQGAGKDGPKK